MLLYKRSGLSLALMVYAAFGAHLGCGSATPKEEGAKGGSTGSGGGGSASKGGGGAALGGGGSALGGRGPGGGGQGSQGGGGASVGGGGASIGGGGKAGKAGEAAAGGSNEPIDDKARANANCSAVFLGDVDISAPSGTFQGSLSVTLSTTISGAQIRYTTDGQTPTASSSLYAAALNLTKTTRLRAAAFVNGALSGTPSAALYIARAIDPTHDVPLVVLDSFGSGKLPTAEAERKFVDVGFLGYDPSDGVTAISSKPTVASFAAFHVRGNSSAMFDKIPYRLEVRNEAGEDRDCPMFGMPAESDWALVGPHADKTLIHNNFVYGLAGELGLHGQRLKLVEVYVNVDDQPLSADDYQGVYQVVETIKNQKNRLNLKQLNETKISQDQISGGYIFKFEWKITPETPLECPATATNCWKALELADPNPAAAEQKAWITDYLVAFNDALHGANPADETSGYPKYIDVQSFVDTIIVNELTRNLDSYVRSQYFYKDRDAKIVAGPIWDFDVIAGVGVSSSMGGGFGLPGGGGGASSLVNTTAEGWQYEANSSRLAGATADWIPVLVANATFRSQLVSRWKELRTGLLSDAALASRIDSVSAGLANAADRNFKKWNILSRARVEPFDTPTESSWSGQLTYMKTWLQKRAAWLDGQWK